MDNKIYPTMVIRSQAETIELLEKEIKKQQEKINTYENPEDLTLMFMYCNEKAKDKIKELNNKIDKAINDLEIIIDIVRKQPSGNDCWIIERLEANKNILKNNE